MTETLTADQGYKAMLYFLEDYYRLTGADDVGTLLGSMSLLENGRPADPGMAGDWHRAIEQALAAR